jgi:galacturan 1,4-alpha-galacturonidase
MRSLVSQVVFVTLATLASANPWGPPPKGPANNGQICTVKALGNKKDDTPQILKAFEKCNNGGTVVFPESENYWIGTKLNPIISDVTVDWKGVWTVWVATSDLTWGIY